MLDGHGPWAPTLALKNNDLTHKEARRFKPFVRKKMLSRITENLYNKSLESDYSSMYVHFRLSYILQVDK